MSDKAENRPIATVAVERTFFNLDSDYDYAVPLALADRVRPGVAVEVPITVRCWTRAKFAWLGG